MEDVKATCFSYFTKSKTRSKGETSHKPWSRCASVWIFLVDGGWNSFIWILSLQFFFGMGYIFSLFFDTPCRCVAYLLWVCIFSPSLSLSFDMPCGHVAYLLWVCIFYFFFIAHTFLMIMLERDSHGTTWSFICGWMDVLAILQVLEV